MAGQTDVVSFAILLGMLSLIPLIVVCSTSFLKISLVLLVLRNALGVQQVPPTIAIYGVALIMSVFVMAPTVQQIGANVMHLQANQADGHGTGGAIGSAAGGGAGGAGAGTLLLQARDALEPLHAFMLRYSQPEQRALFLESARKLWPKDMARAARDSDTLIVIPAFIVSELQAGYQIGFLIYIPFVVIDLLVSNLLMALGMQQVSPQTITIPLKLLLFVLVNGWAKLLNALALSYL